LDIKLRAITGVFKTDNGDRKLAKTLYKLVAWLWQNRWIQDGEEAIGYSNFALVSFKWSEKIDGEKMVIQDVYWRAPWQEKHIVYSRYHVSLQLDVPPPQIREVSQIQF
jgi:hypothetical protein